jgi:succinyl-CoA synthetase beta subunit
VLVEESVAIEREFYWPIGSPPRAPVLIFSSLGGTGEEDNRPPAPDKLARH